MAAPTINVERPARRARKGGLLQVVEDVRDNVAHLAVSAGIQYEAQPCTLTFDQIELCYTAFEATGDKETQAPTWGTAIGENFGAYYAVQCFLDNGTTAEFEALASQGLEMGESRALEARLNTYLGTLVPIAAASLAAQVGALEELADGTYVGMPILHVSRNTAVAGAAADVFFPDPARDGRLYTANGTPVVASARYTDTLVGLTGDITVLRSAMFANSGYQITKNLEASVAERVYNLIVDCGFAAAATITAA